MLGIGQRVTVRLAEAVPLTGGVMLELLTVEGAPLPTGGGGRGKGRGGPRKPASFKAHERGVKRKLKRVRRDS